MPLRRLMVLLLAYLTAGCAVSRPAEQPENAATLYLAAAESLPHFEYADERARHILFDIRDAPLDDAAVELVGRADESLRLFDRASAVQFPGWPTSDRSARERSIHFGLSEVAEFVSLRARLRAQAGDFDRALTDCENLMLLARRISHPASLNRQLQHNVISNRAASVVAEIMPSLSERQIRGYFARVESLPPPAAPVDIATFETQAFLIHYREIIEDPEALDAHRDSAALINRIAGTNYKPTDLDDLTTNRKRAEEVLASASVIFDNVIQAMRLPPDECEKELRAMREGVKKSHPLAQDAFVIAAGAHDGRISHAVSDEMLRVAADICAKLPRPIDPDAAQRMSGRFEYRPTPEGFQLRLEKPRFPHILHVGSVTVRKLEPETD